MFCLYCGNVLPEDAVFCYKLVKSFPMTLNSASSAEPHSQARQEQEQARDTANIMNSLKI